MSQAFSVVGKRLPRADAVDKATGAAKYTIDIKLPGMLIGKVLRSPYPHAKILKIDTSKAKKLPGVQAVITAEDTPKKGFNISMAEAITVPERQGLQDQQVLADKARFAGDAVAALAAIDERIAEEALKLIEVEYEKLPAVFDIEEAVKPDAPRIHDFAERNIALHFVSPLTMGDVERGFQEADCVIEQTFHTSKQKHCQLELSSCVARFDATGRLTIWSPHQGPHLARTQIAALFDIPAGMIRWLTPPVGGAFGGGASLRAEPICIALAKKTGKPVKLEYSREEEFIATETRQPFIQTAKLGVKKNGIITALQVKATSNAGAYFTHSGSTTGVSVTMFLSLYKCPNMAGEADIVYTNIPISGGFRGYGNPQAMFTLEQMVDMAAEKIGIDPIELRMKNIKKAGELAMGLPIESTALDECIRLGAERIDWQKKRGREKEGIRRQGVGMAIMMHVSGSFPFLLEHSGAFIRLNEDGSANLMVSAMDMGQGISSSLAQIAAEELGLHAEDIHVVSGDTDVTPFDSGQHASRSIYVMGNAVQRAAREAKQELLERAAKMLSVSADNLDVEDRRVYIQANPEKGLSVAEVTRNTIYNFERECSQISGKCSFEQVELSPPFEAVFAEVEVDVEVGEVKVLRMVIAHDIGQAINPTTVEGQLEGGATQGIGYGLTEDFVINKNTGTLESDNFTTYKLLSSLDLPKIETILIEKPDPKGPFGAKSVGESGSVAIAAAIGNAIYDAVGVRITELPITAEKVLKALKAN